jgi:4'-phosphopantetheinyl transferase
MDRMTPGRSFELPMHDVHVWTLDSGASEAMAARFLPILAPDEKERAARFRFDRLQHSFVVTRGVLRCLLACYVDVPPGGIRFAYGAKGKPALASAAGIEFNATHSGGFAMFAFAIGCRVGVDVELMRPMAGAADIAERFFCPEEAAEIGSLPLGERERAFFRCWTRKEAYIKAIGDGLSAPLDGFRVTLRPGEPARLVHIAHDTDAAQAWTLDDLGPAAGYMAALAYRDRRRSLSTFPIHDPARLLDAT